MAQPTQLDVQRYRALFPITEHFAYLNHAVSAPAGQHVSQAIQTHLVQRQMLPSHLLANDIRTRLQAVQALAQTLLNAERPSTIAPIPSAEAGLTAVAANLPLRAGDEVLVVEGDAASALPWLALTHTGVNVRRVRQQAGAPDLDHLQSQIDRRTRVVALSSALGTSNARIDLAAVGEICRAHDLLFVVDASPTLGFFPIDVQACAIDVLVGVAHRGLLGLWASSLLYARPGLLDMLKLDLERQCDADASLDDTDDLGLVALAAVLDLVREVGVDTIEARINTLTSLLVDDLRSRGFVLRGRYERPHESNVVAVVLPDPQRACERLRDAHVVASVAGDTVWLAPHFYTDEDDVLRVGAALGSPAQHSARRNGRATQKEQ